MYSSQLVLLELIPGASATGGGTSAQNLPLLGINAGTAARAVPLTFREKVFGAVSDEAIYARVIIPLSTQ